MTDNPEAEYENEKFHYEQAKEEAEADWLVEEITPTKDALEVGEHAFYRLHVRGTNLSRGGEPFAWTVRDVSDPRYCLTRAKIDPRAMPFLATPKESRHG